jgi:hypothetical protein
MLQRIWLAADEVLEWTSYVRFWHKADIPEYSTDVRFWG